MQVTDYDVCVIGGGINGAGIARDAAGRGLSVLLVEAGDLASATSSSSTKLIHGGLRYLEYGEFRLVRDSLKEREILLALAPHIIRPLDFVLPHDAGQRPYWMIRAGLFLYDHLARRRFLHGSRGLNFSRHPAGAPLRPEFTRGFCYADCWVEDSRLVVLNAMSAAAKGAHIRTRTACLRLKPEADRWGVTIRDLRTGEEREITAAMVVNAAGPWVRGVIEQSALDAPQVPKIRLVKGSHIIIKKRFDAAQAYILQQPDRRIVFAIPYERDYTLIGTTEVDYTGDPVAARISPEEITYLCAAYNRAFSASIGKDDIIWTYSGVRPLFDDGGDSATSVTRDYCLYHHGEFTAPLLSVFGGKLTTYRVLAEQAVNKLVKLVNFTGQPWTAREPLPGGNIEHADFGAFLDKKAQQYPWLPEGLLCRYARAYGTRMDAFLEGARGLDDLGTHYGDHVYEAEILYLVRAEFAKEADDILWRRSKLGLHVAPLTVKNIERALQNLIREKAA